MNAKQKQNIIKCDFITNLKLKQCISKLPVFEMFTLYIDRILNAAGHVPQTFLKSCGVTMVTATRMRSLSNLMEVGLARGG